MNKTKHLLFWPTKLVNQQVWKEKAETLYLSLRGHLTGGDGKVFSVIPGYEIREMGNFNRKDR